ncbi:type I-E CRISPR-associated protein Cse1/CasA [Roseateles amylovorans]|uniref:Type I-E CRISPR-associated protein Cse1/CasA n=1 Tax=Roseateles amylovorans TaxID=2978473 RepID=A0ABY6AV42_9BURK|nr:type I-E CRISPR-associated protein Cse1/CasA [Roseateles amylovorans]UXH76793.1 type I-E CRISPR-associated protein Cse1/CasA [Roseateles amylovorans]
MTSHYNLLDEPWLPVRFADATVRSVGLIGAIRHSKDITALAETAPPSLIAQYRLLLAIVHRALVRSRANWKDADRVTWFQHGLPIEEISAYLESLRDRFWLFDESHPFMQVAALAVADETREKRKPWTQISLASANGNAPVVFDHAVDAMPVAIDRAQAITHLLGYLQFTPGGLVKTLRDADKAGALVNTAAVLPVGETLAKTLCLALHPAPLPGQPTEDLPAWERPPLTLAELRGEPVLATGPNDRYTRQSRAVLLEAEPDGSVRWLRFAAGWALGEDPQKPDPMACYRAGSLGLVRVGFNEGRAVWRDLPALVPMPQGEATKGYQAAAVVDWAAGLRRMIADDRVHQPLLVAGLASDQAKLLRWRLEQVVLPQELLVLPDRAQELQVGVALAEELHRQLRYLASDLVAATLPDPSSKDTRNRARSMVDVGPLSTTFFAAAERDLPALMALIAKDDSDGADALWQGALRDAARLAWDRVIAVLGNSVVALRAEARIGYRLSALLRQQLPAAFPVSTRTQGA